MHIRQEGGGEEMVTDPLKKIVGHLTISVRSPCLPGHLPVYRDNIL